MPRVGESRARKSCSLGPREWAQVLFIDSCIFSAFGVGQSSYNTFSITKEPLHWFISILCFLGIIIKVFLPALFLSVEDWVVDL